jgi:phage head maturation protease
MAHKLERRNIKATEIRMSTGADGAQVLTGYAMRFNSPPLIWVGSQKSALLACSHGPLESHPMCVCSVTM